MKTWKTIVVGTDFSAGARRALESLPAVAGADTRVELVHVVEAPSAGYAMLIAAAGAPDPVGIWREAGEAQITAAVARLRRTRRAVRGSVRVGKPWHQILLAAKRAGADLIVLGASGHSKLERLVLGSTAENVVRRSDVPVLVVREKPLRRIRRVVLPLDFEEGSRLAARFLRDGLPRGARVDALHVVPPPIPFDFDRVAYLANEPAGMSAELRRSLEEAGRSRELAAGAGGGGIDADVRRFLDQAGLPKARVTTRLFGDPAAEVLAFAADADVVVLATHGRSGVARALLGSVAEKVVRHAPCPVLVLPMRGGRRSEQPRRRVAPARAASRASRRFTAGAPPRRGAARGAWNPQAQPGRGGPAGRRGSGGSGRGRSSSR